ncbi:T3SS effector EspK [Xenorhabdus mauleonii]|uniref:T3SS effector EspK n=1 Tax=Xenorhabdus mauleonii TaxID=351675 RepID=A0A1I3LNW5_9GAMM|nr:hypothetical protein [Xenorhabdus mauleonii]PHM45249.1 T3SS effector EspK [Xenorhabdus mauleonii]SFI86195.1 hypothetical protein SAMN05421680_10415 [Xenorhabdus mauleonii]
MTHNQIPIVKIASGDLIYGLSKERSNYVKTYTPFQFIYMKYHPEENDHHYIPTTMDHFVIPFERLSSDDLYKQSANRRDYNMSLPENRGIRDSYNTYMKNHKYHTAVSPKYVRDDEFRKKHFSRKCKGGLSWVVMSNDPIVQNIKIHFILDGIDMKSVVRKESYNGSRTNITASELRWIYRNRHNPKVKQKIHFWLRGQLSMPPWENPESREIWKEYIPVEELPQTHIMRF